MASSFTLPQDLLEHLPKPDPQARVWVVGGAIRDHILGIQYLDVDLALDGDAIKLARAVADKWGWDFFVLDGERGAARILRRNAEGSVRRVDFARLRGTGIKEDLHKRDFTINAMAIDPFNLAQIIDPTGGISDLRSRKLRACGPDTLTADPVRAIRAIRFATNYDLKIDADTSAQIKGVVPELESVSMERIRDELFLILNSRRLNTSLRLLDHLGILAEIFPANKRLKQSSNGDAQASDLWNLTLARFREFDQLAHVLERDHDAEAAADAILGSAALRLGRFREELDRYLNTCLSDDRSRRSLMAAALLLDAAQPRERISIQRDEVVRVTPTENRESYAQLAAEADRLRLSRLEARFISRIVHALDALGQRVPEYEMDDLDVFRYYRIFGEAGVGAVLFYLVDALAEAPGPPDADLWRARLDMARSLWEAYFERRSELIDPAPIVDGTELMAVLGIGPGPELGALLETLLEAQVSGEVGDLASAIKFARQQLGMSST